MGTHELEFAAQPNSREFNAQPKLMHSSGVGAPIFCQLKSVNQIIIVRDTNERNFQKLVEDHVTSIETANSLGRLLPAREVVDQLDHCRWHNSDRRDKVLLGHLCS